MTPHFYGTLFGSYILLLWGVAVVKLVLKLGLPKPTGSVQEYSAFQKRFPGGGDYYIHAEIYRRSRQTLHLHLHSTLVLI